MVNRISEISEDIVLNTKQCNVCLGDIKYVAIFRGKHNPEIVGSSFGAIPINAVVTERRVVNFGKGVAVNIEFVVKCPHCESNNKFTDFKNIISHE